MIVINFNSGLGNQMFHYAMYLRLKYENPDQKVYTDVSVYRSAGMEKKFELLKIFEVELNDVEALVSRDQYAAYIQKSKKIVNSLPHNWLSKISLLCSRDMCELLTGNHEDWIRVTDLVSIHKKSKTYAMRLFLKRIPVFADVIYKMKSLEKKVNMREFYSEISKCINVKNYKINNAKYLESLLKTGAKNTYYIGNFESGTLYFQPVEAEIRKAFKFPELDVENYRYAENIKSGNSISVHLRRGDHLISNEVFFSEGGYYYNAINYIKKTVENPKFFIFSDDMKWCKENLYQIGLSSNDSVYYVEGNIGQKAFRDMQLMSMCKHNIIPISTFSWWASYLNANPNKIVIAPKGYWAEATVNL